MKGPRGASTMGLRRRSNSEEHDTTARWLPLFMPYDNGAETEHRCVVQPVTGQGEHSGRLLIRVAEVFMQLWSHD